MISFAVDPRFIQDLEDDFMVNEDKTFYDFIGKDPVRAFYLGLYIQKWYSDIDKNQRYLYSKQARHNKDDLEKYQTQMEFWSKKFPKDGDEIDMVELAEYILNNMFWEEGSEEIDLIKMAFFFGNTIYNSQASSEDETPEPSQEKRNDTGLQEVYE